ncbi:MAG: hypothetical protein ACFE7S_07260, partial [Candidatus Hodarchaeota archaeon]
GNPGTASGYVSCFQPLFRVLTVSPLSASIIGHIGIYSANAFKVPLMPLRPFEWSLLEMI